MSPVGRVAAPDGPLWLWLGAIGPLPITAIRLNSTLFQVRFRDPLDERIVAHFGAAQRPCPTIEAPRAEAA